MPRLKPHVTNEERRERLAASPGPGEYDVRSVDVSAYRRGRARSVAFGGKMANAKRDGARTKRWSAPGPGQYIPKSDFDSGSRSLKSSFSKSKRDAADKTYSHEVGAPPPTFTPGPGAYAPPQASSAFLPSGSYGLSSKRTSPAPSFGGSLCMFARSKSVPNSVPGPGEYSIATPAAGPVKISRFPTTKGAAMPKAKRFSGADKKPATQSLSSADTSTFKAHHATSMKSPAKFKFTGRTPHEVTLDKNGMMTVRPSTAPTSPGPGSYPIQSTIARRKSGGCRTSFGTAKRDENLRPADSPGPGAYGLAPSMVGGKQATSNVKSAPSIGFLKGSRESAQTVVAPGAPKPVSKGTASTPGPGAYGVSSGFSKQALSGNRSSTGFRTSKAKRDAADSLYEGFGDGKGDANVAARGRDSPGPGAYAPIEKISAISTKRSSQQWKFGTASRDQATRVKAATDAGPGAYGVPNSDSTSRRKSASAFSFGKSNRDATVNAPGIQPKASLRETASLPGPGAYRSEDGLLRSSLSTHSNARGGKFGSVTRDQWAAVCSPGGPKPTVKNGAPGAGTYAPLPTMGKVPISTKPSCPGTVFGTSERPLFG